MVAPALFVHDRFIFGGGRDWVVGRSETCLSAWLRMVYVDIVSWNRLSLRMLVLNGRLSFCKLGGGDVSGARLTRHVRAHAASVRACIETGQCPHSAHTVPAQCPHSAHTMPTRVLRRLALGIEL